MTRTPAATHPTAIRARWILTAESPPIRDGLLVVHQGRITSIGSAPGGDSPVPWQEAAILPAFVNAHTHLEFSSLAAPIGQTRMSFTDWIRQVIAWRRQRDAGQDEAAATNQRRRAIQAGLVEAQRTGTIAIGEIATSPLSQQELESAAVAGVAFMEWIGLSPERIGPLINQARSFLDSPLSNKAFCRPGLSPHAPYSVHPHLIAELVRLSAERRVPVAMHLAETIEELQLLRDGTGPFVELLQELNAWTPTAIRPGSRPLDYLRILSQAHHALVIHGNYLQENEQAFLAEQRDRMTAVYCPRTHAYFGHSPYPLKKLLSAGVRVALGTDSRASNPDLDMLQELRFAAARDPGVAPDELLKMATLHGAQALGLDGELGSLRPGKRAQFVTVPLPADDPTNPYSWLY